ncbi:hypothetical protein [Vibrio sp. 10N]|uniref:hypothetical protein n=1 Tax=Vibrio sp. 10N TaxID=3058938 RepID=UPI002812D5F5|nr:hypothetical protein VB10N_36070 [Vibrio sp. 10N]
MTTQAERHNPALDNGFFQPHELSFEQLILWAKQFASLIPYRNEFDQQTGDWGALFEKNELVVCAAILSVDEKAWKQQFKQTQHGDVEQTLSFILSVFKQLEDWYHHLPTTPEVSYRLKFTLLNACQTQLRESFQQLYRVTPTQYHAQFVPFDAMWQLSSPKATSGKTTVYEEAQHCLSRILVVIASLKSECRKTFDVSLKHGEHPPQLALYLSFLKLFERAQARINTFSHRHLLFYYRDVLKQAPQQATQSPVFLKLSKSQASQKPVVIEQGHKFSPGNAPDFTPIIYHAAYGMSVTDAEVCNLFHFSLRRDPLISPEKELGLPSSVIGQRRSLDPEMAGHKKDEQSSFALFDSTKPLNVGVDSELQAMGLTVSDPIFAMAEGERSLSLFFELQEVGSSQLYQRLSLLSREDSDNNATTSDDTSDALIIIIKEILELQIPIFRDWQIHIDSTEIVNHIDETVLNKLLSMPAEAQLRALYRELYLALLSITSQALLEQGVNTNGKGDKALLFRVIGQLIARQALYKQQWLSKEHITTVSTLIQSLVDAKLIDKTVHATLSRLLVHSNTQTFYELFEDAFNVEITTEGGWQHVNHAQLVPIEGSHNAQMGFALNVTLEPGFSAVKPIKPLKPNAQAQVYPALRLTLKPQCHCFLYAVLRDFELAEVVINCEVSGVSQLQLFNQDGQTDPSQPFYPFGAQPKDNAYLVIASRELAAKPIKSMCFHFDWADLPQSHDGFRAHYAEYPFDFNNHSFQISTQVLNNGRWGAIGPDMQPLFSPKYGQLERHHHVRVKSMQNSYLPNTQPWPIMPYSPQSPIRNGLFKLTLNEPDCAFGHNDYALLLTQTLSENVKTKKPKPLPNAPYTPLVDKLTISYRATKKVNLTDINDAQSCRIVHLHPFGESQVYPRIGNRRVHVARMLPQYSEDGHVLLGIRASDLSGYLNLYFLLAEESSLLTPFSSQDYQWYYLVDNIWMPLPAKNMIHDTTQGFLNSGVVTLDIPDAANTEHTVMPTGMYWLRVSTNKGLGQYPKCYHVATHVIQANPSDGLSQATQPFAQWQHQPKLANLGTVAQLTPMAQWQASEGEREWITKTSELLRHKGKAESPWDYERIVLQHFPAIGAVDCFAGRQFDSDKPQPGHVLVTVLPNQLSCEHDPCERKNVSAADLLAIQTYLAGVSRPQTQIAVRNPGYEEIQVRCTVAFAEGVHHGLALRQLEYTITQALCPWHQGSLNKGLGWTLSLSKLTAFINQQPNVTHVSGLSVLKVTQDPNKEYELLDSARVDEPISAKLPWYLLISAKHHLIKLSSQPHSVDPIPAGVGDLTIGEQFILAGRDGASGTLANRHTSDTNKGSH